MNIKTFAEAIGKHKDTIYSNKKRYEDYVVYAGKQSYAKENAVNRWFKDRDYEQLLISNMALFTMYVRHETKTTLTEISSITKLSLHHLCTTRFSFKSASSIYDSCKDLEVFKEFMQYYNIKTLEKE